jgi:hypothetical protein
MTTSKPTQDKKVKIVTGVIALVLFLWIFFSVKSCFNDFTELDTPTNQAEKKQYSIDEAFVSSQMFVEQRLQAPATAKFDYSSRNTKQLNDTTFLVKSFVDSENSYGALLRTDYSCVIIFSNDSIKCRDLVLTER